MARNKLIQKRRGTAAAWTAANPVLAAGEEGYETDTRKSKVGDGTTAWNTLDYAYPSSGGTVTASEGLTKTGNDIKLGGILTDTSNQAQVLYESDTAGFLIGPNGGDGGAFQVGPSTAQFTISDADDGHASISAYPALAGLQVASADFSNDNLFLVSPTGLQSTKYPNSRDDTASNTPANYIYTDDEGSFLSSPISSLPIKTSNVSMAMVAASDAPAEDKARADYVCDGTNDQNEINNAILALIDSGGTLLLSKGTFNLSATVTIPGDGTTADAMKVTILGAGADTTQVVPASGVHAFTLTASPKVEIGNMSINLSGASDGIRCTAPDSGSGDRRGFWMSNFHDLQFQGDNSTHSGWVMNLENPFRSTFERIQGLNIKNGIWLKSTYANFNPGNLNFTNCHMDLGIADGTAYYLQSADTGGFFNICTFSECDAIDSNGSSTTSIGWRFKGSGTTYYTTRDILVLRSNVELFNTAVKFEHADNIEFNANFVNTKNNGRVFDFSADSVSNYVSVKYLYVSGTTTTNAIVDLNTEPQRPNVLRDSRARVETGGTLTVTPSAVTVLTQLAKDTDGSGTYPAQWTFTGTRLSLDANVIHTTGNETAVGTKVFENIRAEAPSGDAITVTGTGTNNTILRFKDDASERGAIFSLNATSDFVVRSQADLVLTANQGGTNKSVRFGSSAITIADAYDISLNATTGTKIGTATSQKLAFYNATPVVQPSATTDLGTVLSSLGLRATGTAYPISTSASVAFTGGVRFGVVSDTTATVTLSTSSAKNRFANAASNTITYTLPTTATAGTEFMIKKIDNTANAVTILGTIDGATNYTLSTQWKYVKLVSTATNNVWYIVANN